MLSSVVINSLPVTLRHPVRLEVSFLPLVIYLSENCSSELLRPFLLLSLEMVPVGPRIRPGF